MSLMYAEPDRSSADPGAVTAFVVGTVVGMVVVGGFCSAITMLFGGGVEGALAVGAYCAFWGGPGFGGMMGFILHRHRKEQAAAADAPAGSTGSSDI